MSVSDKMNGDVPDEKSANSAPSSQRKPRINRRSFHLSNNPLVDLLAEKKPAQENSDINGCNDGMEAKKTDSSPKRIISLSSTKSSSAEASDKISSSKGSKIISLKKSSASHSLNTEKREKTVSAEPSSSAEPPPKKKHKPITWP